jgi:hypothetical protein
MQINESLRLNGVLLRKAGLIRRTRIQESTPKADTSPKADKGTVGLKKNNSIGESYTSVWARNAGDEDLRRLWR